MLHVCGADGDVGSMHQTTAGLPVTKAMVNEACFGHVQECIAVCQDAIGEIEVFGTWEVAARAQHLVKAACRLQRAQPQRYVCADSRIVQLCQTSFEAPTPRRRKTDNESIPRVMCGGNDCPKGNASARVSFKSVHDGAKPAGLWFAV